MPLSQQAITILKELWEWTGEYDLILTGAHNPFKPMSENTVNKALRVMGYSAIGLWLSLCVGCFGELQPRLL